MPTAHEKAQRHAAEHDGALAISLTLDDETVYLSILCNDGDEAEFRVGDINNDLSYDVPDSLFDSYHELLTDYRDGITYGNACRSEAAHTYNTTRGV